MNLGKLCIKNIKEKLGFTLLSISTLALSLCLLFIIQHLKSNFQNQIDHNLGKIDMVVGAKGSPLQLVLSSVLHIDNPTGNIPLNSLNKLQRNPLVKSAIPIASGDNYKGYNIVATESDFLSLYNAQIRLGKLFNKSKQVIIGAEVAKKLSLSIGDQIQSSHGLIEDSNHVHEDALEIVGILAPTQKIIDRLIISDLQTIWDIHEHEHQAHTVNEDKEITSILVTFKNKMGLLSLPRKINSQTKLQAAIPKYELDKLYNYTSVGLDTVSWIAYCILIIANLLIFVSLYKMVKERSYDLAILRTYGAKKHQLISLVFLEGGIIFLSALIVAAFFTKLGVQLITAQIALGNHQGISESIQYLNFLPEIGLVAIIVIIGIILAIYPILNMDISKILKHEK